MITAKSYFSGAGGMDYGICDAGIKIIQSYEIDPICCKTLRKNFDGDILKARSGLLEGISQGDKEKGGGDKPMTKDCFEELREEFLEHEAGILEWKRGEYAPNDDRLQNFREVAAFFGQRPAEVALTYLMKHIQSIALAVRTGNYTWAWTTEGGEGLKQRFADARNYLLLLAACLEEESQT